MHASCVCPLCACNLLFPIRGIVLFVAVTSLFCTSFDVFICMLVKLGFRMIAIALFVMIVTMWRRQGGRGAGGRGAGSRGMGRQGSRGQGDGEAGEQGAGEQGTGGRGQGSRNPWEKEVYGRRRGFNEI